MVGSGFQLVAAAGTLNAITSLAIAIRLYASYLKGRSGAHWYFLLFYLHFGIFYLLFAASQLFFTGNDGVIVGVFHVVSYFFLYLSISYLLSFPFILARKERIARQIVLAVLVYNIIFLIARVFSLEPSVKEAFDQYMYWRPVFPEWMRILTGIFSVTAAGFASTFFFKQGFRHRDDKFIFYRSMWFGSGIAVLILAALLSFIAAPSGSFIFVVVATFLVLAGLLVILRGVYYRKHGELEKVNAADAANFTLSV